MPLEPGSRLGAYEILAAIGAGGMGEVWRARDTTLGREVALKALPPAFLQDPDRLARLEREARILASLNHPNIATLYGFEKIDGVPFLVMELVEGSTLGERLARGPLPMAEALDLFRQVADGLAAAHRKGVVHRDLKPGNLKIAPGGLAKILDFGLAISIAPMDGAGDDGAETASLRRTAAGAILGTAPYMAPEQAMGRPADERSDIFSFGATLFEALAGTRAFPGDSAAATLAAVIERDPDWSALPAGTPELVRFLLRRCVKKNPDDRLRDITEARALLGDASTSAAPMTSAVARLAAPRGRSRKWMALGLCVLALLSAGVFIGRSIPRGAADASPPVVRRFQFAAEAAGAPSISPDGRHIGYAEGGRLKIRDLDRVESRDVPGSEGAADPFWSPDSRHVAFRSGPFLKRAPIDGGPVATICELQPPGVMHLGSAWGPSGRIVVALGPGLGLFEVSSDGGDLKLLLKPDPATGIFDFHQPAFLPDGRTLLVGVHPETRRRFYPAIVDGSHIRRVLPESTPPVNGAVYSASGHILYDRPEGTGALFAVPFDAMKMVASGEPTRLAEDAASPSVSGDGSLVYVSGRRRVADLVLVSRAGRVVRTISQGHEELVFPRVSPDGKRVMYTETKEGNLDVWVENLETGARVRLTAGPEMSVPGAWSSSGARVALMSGGWSDGRVVLVDADGGGRIEPLPFRSSSLPEAIVASPDWSPDGRFVLFRSRGDLFYGDMTEKSAATPLVSSPFTESEGRFSPDGRYVAYMSNESGRFEVYVRPFPGSDRKWVVSTAGGALPRWSRRGDELFYLEDERLMAASVSTRGEFRSAPPTLLFDAAALGINGDLYGPLNAAYDPLPDGQGFVFVQAARARPRAIEVVENWVADLKRRP